MSTGTRETGKKGTRTRPATVPEEVPSEPQAEAEDDGWADENSLPTGKTYRDVDLPVLKQKARVRFLTNIEATQLALLPDLRAFAMLMAKVQNLAQAEKLDQFSKEEDAKLSEERMRYMTVVAHFCVMRKGSKVGVVTTCEDCGLDHPPSMWTMTQVRYLHPNDLALLANTAERGWELERVLPLSKEQTESPTSQPANTGESIPDATS